MPRYRTRMDKLRKLVSEAGIRHFSASELVRHDASEWGHRREYPPPIRMASNIIPTLCIADRLRDEWGDPVQVVSGYRCPAYNDFVVGGAEDSQHIYFRALDLQPVNGRYDEWVTHCEQIIERLRSNSRVIGMGRYDTFVHIDTGHYDHNRDWDRR